MNKGALEGAWGKTDREQDSFGKGPIGQATIPRAPEGGGVQPKVRQGAASFLHPLHPILAPHSFQEKALLPSVLQND